VKLVVERLRCCADDSLRGNTHPWAHWFYDLHQFDPVHRVACMAWDRAYDIWCTDDEFFVYDQWWACVALEASALVEEGTLP